MSTRPSSGTGREPREVEVTDSDLPLHCPMPAAPLWARHPRVFLDVTRTGTAMCAYCGTRYVYKGGAQQAH